MHILRKKALVLFVIFVLTFFDIFCINTNILVTTLPVNAASTSNDIPNNLYATYAALIDGDSGRVLFDKNGNTPAPMASTTKIMTLIITLEYADLNSLATISKYAATMPDVQLNVNRGEHYVLNDLLYSLMLKSHNDSAVAIAENVAYSYVCDRLYSGSYVPSTCELDFNNYNLDFMNATLDLSTISIEQSKVLISIFAGLMNLKAHELGCNNTYFITPNGLDASDDYGVHSTSAIDLATIMSYCIKNECFLQITETPTYTFCNKTVTANGDITNGSRQFTVTNANTFLNSMDGVISGKTGFTGNAGYCYVCALKRDDKTFISVVLACGWPSNKNYKWTDTKKILSWGLSNYTKSEIFTPVRSLKTVTVTNGTTNSVDTYVSDNITTLLSNYDNVNIIYALPESIKAPIDSGDVLGSARIFINDQLYTELPIQASSSVTQRDFAYCYRIILSKFLCIVLS